MLYKLLNLEGLINYIIILITILSDEKKNPISVGTKFQKINILSY